MQQFTGFGVLNQDAGGSQGPGDISGFRINRWGGLASLRGSTQPLSTAGFTHGGQIGFAPDGRSLIVTEEATNTLRTISASVPSGQTEVCWTVLNHSQRYTRT